MAPPCATDALPAGYPRAQQAFYRQLSAWVLYGQQADPYGEFFVARTDERRNPARQQEAGAAAGGAGAAAAAQGPRPRGITVGGADADGGAAEWHDAFYVDVRCYNQSFIYT